MKIHKKYVIINNTIKITLIGVMSMIMLIAITSIYPKQRISSFECFHIPDLYTQQYTCLYT